MRKLLFGIIAVIVVGFFFASCNEAKKEVSRGEVVSMVAEDDPYRGPYTSVTDSLIKTGRQCPSCHGDSIATIEYGLVTEEERNNMDSLENELRKRKHVLGGCVVSADSPKYYCYMCGRKW